MTVETTTTIAGPYPTNGIATAFPFNFKALSADEVEVVLVIGGVEAVVAASLYRVVLSDQSGSVVFTAAPESGANLFVRASPDFKQNVKFSNQSAFLPESHNEANDRAALRDQVLAEGLGRSFQIPFSGGVEGMYPVVLPGGAPGFSAGTGNDPALRTDLAQPGGAGLANFDGRSVAAKLGDVVSVKDAKFSGGAKGDGVTDDTAAIQAAINAVRDGGTLLFPSGFYKVTTLDSGRSEVTWIFDNAKLLAGATAAVDCLIRFRGLHCRIDGMQINGNFNTNYTCMLWWYNATEASQHNSFVNLEIRYTKRAIIYGAMPGQTSTFYAQSENSIINYRTRGVEKPLYNNHANGFLFLVTPQLVAHDEEWAGSGATFDRSANRSFEIAAGTLTITGGEIQNTIDPLGNAADVFGGVVYINGVITEVSVPFYVSGGQLRMNGGRILNTQSITPQFKIPSTAGAGAAISCVDVKMERNAGVGGFSNQPLVDNAGASTVDMLFANCEFDDWASTVPLVTDHAESVKLEGVRYMPDGGAPSSVFRLDTGGQDLLDRMSIDRTGNTTEGFYPVLFYGGTTSGQNADVPSSAFATSMFVNTAGEAGFFTADGTSLATLKQTALRCRPGDRFLVEGWIRKVSGDNAGFALIQFDGAGAMLSTAYLMVADATGGFVTGAWRYVRQIVTVPVGSAAAFVGPGIAVKVGEGRFCGLQMRRADWNRR